MTPRCDYSAYNYGLCEKCYRDAQSLVSRGIATWEVLVSIGLAEADRPDLFREAASKKLPYVTDSHFASQ